MEEVLRRRGGRMHARDSTPGPCERPSSRETSPAAPGAGCRRLCSSTSVALRIVRAPGFLDGLQQLRVEVRAVEQRPKGLLLGRVTRLVASWCRAQHNAKGVIEIKRGRPRASCTIRLLICARPSVRSFFPHRCSTGGRVEPLLKIFLASLRLTHCRVLQL